MSSEPGEILDARIDDTGRRVRQIDLSLSVLVLLSLISGSLLLAVLADHWLFAEGMPHPLRYALFFALVTICGLYIHRRIVPLFQRSINPVYIANVLEEAAPSQNNSIVNWILLRHERKQREDAQYDERRQDAAEKSVNAKLADRMFDGVTRTAAKNVAAIPMDRAVDLRGLARWGIVLTVILLILMAYSVLSPKSSLASLVRIAIPISGLRAPQAVYFENVEPGNTVVRQGERLSVSAELTGSAAGQEPVQLVFSTDDGQAVQQVLLMERVDNSAPDRDPSRLRYETLFPPSGQGTVSGIVSGVDYWLRQGGSRSARFRIEVRPAAVIEVSKLTYRFPPYTGLAEEVVENSGDIRAVEGTEVQIDVRSSLPLQRIDLVQDGRATTLKSADNGATGTVTLKHDAESQAATTERSFTFRAWDTDGVDIPSGGVFHMEILADQPPAIQWSDTNSRLQDALVLEVPLKETLELPIQAEDPDFGLRYLRFHVESPGKHIRPAELLESSATGPTQHTGLVKAVALFSPVTSRLNVGDSAAIWVEAIDTKFPGPNVVETRRIDVKIVESKKEEKKEETETKEDEKGKGDDSDSQSGQNDQNSQTSPGNSADNTPPNEAGQNQGGGEQASAEEDASEGEGESGSEGKSGKSDDSDSQGGQNNQNTQTPSGGEGDGTEGSAAESSAAGSDGAEGGKNDANAAGTGADENSGNSQDNSSAGNQPPRVDPDTQDGDAMERILEQMRQEENRGNANSDSQPEHKPPAPQNPPGDAGTPGTEQTAGTGQGRGEEVPVDPNDHGPRERDRSLDPDSHQRRGQGGDATDPTKSNRNGEGEQQGTPQGKQDNSQSPTGNDAQNFQHAQTPNGDLVGTPVKEDSAAGTPSNEGGQGQGDGEQSQGGQGGEKSEAGGGKAGDGKAGDGKAGDGGKSGHSNSPNGNNAPNSQPSPTPPSPATGTPAGAPSDSTRSEPSKKMPVGGGGTALPSQPETATPTEDANLEYTEKVTNLVLEYLENQLKNKPSQELLDRLGWSEQELRNFHEKWKAMAERAKTPEARIETDTAWKEALKSLGLRPPTQRQELRRFRTGTADEKHAVEAQRYAPPRALQKRFQRYSENISTK